VEAVRDRVWVIVTRPNRNLYILCYCLCLSAFLSVYNVRVLCLITGLMTQSELTMYDNYATSGNKFFVPTVWAASLVYKSRRDGRIKFDIASNQIIEVSKLLNKYTCLL